MYRDVFMRTVKSLCRGHHRDLKIVPVRERCLLHRDSCEISLFYFKIYSRVLGYSVIEPKMCQKVGVQRKKEPKDNTLEDIMLI